MNELMAKSKLVTLFSPALFKENWKRFWAIPVLGFIIYFLSGIYTLIRCYASAGRNEDLASSYLRSAYSTVKHILQNDNFGLLFVEATLPVVIAIALFSYLNKANSVNTLHALPFARRQLYISNIVSGITLFAVPQLLTLASLFILKRPTFLIDYDGNLGTVDIFTSEAILNWFNIAFTSSLFVFALCVLGCILCGNGVIAFLTGCALNVIVPVCYICCEYYAMDSYFGFAEGSFFGKVLMNFHPLVELTTSYSTVAVCVYLAIALVIIALADALYYYRKMERCTDSYVFVWAKHVVGFLFMFIITTGIFAIFGDLYGEPTGTVILVIGGIIGFALGQMISRKTFKIFDLTSLKNLVIYAVIMAAIIVGIKLDITGYQKRVPAVSSVKSVTITAPGLDPYRNYNNITFNETESISYAVALHQSIVDNMDTLKFDEGSTTPWDVDRDYISITYDLGGENELRRQYHIDSEFLEKQESLYKLRNCEEATRPRKNTAALDASDLSINIYISDLDEMLAQKYPDSYKKKINSKYYNSTIYFGSYQEAGIAEPKEGEDVYEYLSQYGYSGIFPKEDFWKAVKTDLLNTNPNPNEYGYIGEINVWFTKSGLTEKEANDIARSLYDGAGYYCVSEAAGRYEFNLGMQIYDNMEETVNWIVTNLK